MRRHVPPAPEPSGDLTPEGRTEWLRITALLRQRGVLDPLDQGGLHDLIVCWQGLKACQREIAERGVLINGRKAGSKVKNPAIGEAREFRAAYLKWAIQFGLTPLSRKRLGIAAPSDDDVFAGVPTVDEFWERDRLT